MLAYIQAKFDFSNYQMKQLQYFFKSSLAECSKIIILVFIFRKELLLFSFAAVLLCSLRIYSGGLHCKTYVGCFLTSLLFFEIVLRGLIKITLPTTLQLLLLLICIIAGYFISPVTSRCHMELTPEVQQRCRLRYITIIFFYLLSVYIIPTNQYLQTGFWVIILQTLQLMLAKIQKKGDFLHEG